MHRARLLAVALVAVTLGAGRFGAPGGEAARAAKPEDAPQESRDQVDAALRALGPVLKKPGRAFGRPGSIESVISAYAPLKFHPVAEGALPALLTTARCPDDMALAMGRFCVDKFEGSLVTRGEGGKETPYPHFQQPVADGTVYYARSVRGVIPQAYISAAQAQAACAASGKRLCQAVEWRAACGGSQATAYPYGPTRTAGKCHDTGTAPMVVLFSATMKKGWGREEMNDPRLNQLAGTVAKTGDYDGCVNDFGVYDMVGNLHEWTADPNGTFQGGYWLDTSQHGDGCAYRTIAHEYAYHDYSTGFRCCADAKTE
jgi:formylglycine-generating enzyme